MMWSLSAWRRRRALQRDRTPAEAWRAAFARLPLLDGLTPEEQQRLRELAILFLHEKTVEATAGLSVTEDMRRLLALQAALPILHLGLDWYRGWVSVIVYPDSFVPEREEVDEAGVVHLTRHPLSGESWLHGPLILSWADIAQAGAADGYNLVIHELAHKLDMLDGEPNGLPPLHRDMNVRAWAQAFSQAYADFQQRVDAGEATVIDPYGAEDPAEFFAVLSEHFFETPAALARLYPAVYAQLCAFYRQDPAARRRRYEPPAMG